MQVKIPPNSNGRIGLPKLSTLPSIHVNGVPVYANNVSINNTIGLKYVGEDDNYIYFNTPISNNHASIFSFDFKGNAIIGKAGWKHCANEGQFCSFNGFAKVSFGNGNRKVILTKSNGVNCSVSGFGSDPALGVVKQCQIFINPNLPKGSMECVNENGFCSFSGLRKVEYGANQIFASKTLTNGTSCSNVVFGDPIYGIKKSCHLYPESLWTSCAQEHGDCFTEESTVVRFGTQGRYLFKPVDGDLKATSTECTSATFGQDPALGLEKKCEISPLPPKGVWTQCAAEGSSCNFQGGRTVAYGGNGNYVYKFVRGSIECTNAAFGMDPDFMTTKGCYFDSGRPWTPCSDELGICNTLEPVSIRFGANDSYAVMDAVISTSISTKCSNTTFGGDPALNVLKDCSYTQMPPKGGWMRCAGEGDKCSFDGVRTMAYGANGKFVFKTVSTGALCTNTTFGTDPSPQVPKECFHD
jgi:hypothetical protein